MMVAIGMKQRQVNFVVLTAYITYICQQPDASALRNLIKILDYRTWKNDFMLLE